MCLKSLKTPRKRVKIGKTLKKPVETAVLPLTNSRKSRKVDSGTVLRTRMNIGDSHRSDILRPAECAVSFRRGYGTCTEADPVTADAGIKI
jgi:hypothetical protein